MVSPPHRRSRSAACPHREDTSVSTRCLDAVRLCTYTFRCRVKGLLLASLAELPPDIQSIYPIAVSDYWEIHDWRNATVIMSQVHPQEWDELMEVLAAFRLMRSNVLRPGGNKSKISAWIDIELGKHGWSKRQFDTKVVVDAIEYASPTHEVDCFKNRVALEVEWNNKDPFYDRDLNNFRLLFDLKAIDLGIIVTRTDELQSIFNTLGRGSSYGESTTHMRKLLPKVEGGGAGGCPILVFGITRALYIEDHEQLTPAERQDAISIETAAAIQEREEDDE